MSGSRSVRERLLDSLVGATLPYSDRLSQVRCLPALIEAGIVAERLVPFRSRASDQRKAKEVAARQVLLDGAPPRSSRGSHRHVFWHESGSGQVILLLNGWTASGLMWPRSFLGDLERDHHVVRVDNRGTGYARTAPTPFRISDLADDAADVLEAIGSGRAVVLGISMGGMIAQELALRHPELVERLVLVATRPPAPAHIPPNRETAMSVMAAPSPGTEASAVVRALWSAYCAEGFGDASPHLLDELVEQAATRQTPRAAVLAQMRAIAAWRGPGRLASIRCPTTVVHGSEDRLMPVGNGMRLARLIPGATYVEVAGVGHMVPMEATERLIEILRSSVAA